MDLQRRDEFKQRLYELTPIDGKAMGNASLREALQLSFPGEQFTLADYWDCRNSLITESKPEKGHGQGGRWDQTRIRPVPVAAVTSGTLTIAALAPGGAVVVCTVRPRVRAVLAASGVLRPWAGNVPARES